MYDPHDPRGRLLFNALVMVAEIEAHLIRRRTLGPTSPRRGPLRQPLPGPLGQQVKSAPLATWNMLRPP